MATNVTESYFFSPKLCLLKGEKYMFNVGDFIVYPMHGAGTIDAIEEKDILGEKQSYYILKMPGEVKVMVPTNKAEQIGVRNIIDKSSAEKVFSILEEDETEMSMNWNKRYRDNMEKMKSGDVYEVADVVRNLSIITTKTATLKENIEYIKGTDKTRDISNNITTSDMYEFIRDDLKLATYNYIDSEDKKYGFIAQDIELLDRFNEKKQLPTSIICKEFGKTRRYLDEWRDYIVTYVVILSDTKYKHIQDYLSVIEDQQKDIDVDALTIFKEDKDISGIVITTKKNKAMIMTSMGDVLKIKTN